MTTTSRPAGQAPAVRSSLWCAVLVAICAGTFPGTAAAQSCAPSHQETVHAAFAQFAELGGRNEWTNDWVRLLGEGHTVKYMMYANLHDPGYFARFVNGREPRAILTDLYRHVLAREPDDGAWVWLDVAAAQGWHAVIDGLLNSGEYNTRFGEHVVPGDPVVAWDCTRASFTALAHQGTSRDATQGSATVSYTTPAYVSLDQPRSLTFAYSSGTAKPTGLVQVNLVEPGTTTADRASIQLYINNAAVTGETFFAAGAGATRLAAQFDASSNYSAAYLVTATVRTYQGANRLSEKSLTGRVPVVNERNSPFGAGWTLGGYQRMTHQGDGVFVTEGGVGVWFERLGACGTDGICRYTSPAGDFSTMTYNGYTFDRRYPDGTVVRFEHDGRMLDHRDRFGNLTVYRYDGESRLSTITDPIGKVTTLSYTGAGALAWVQDPAGRRVTNESYNNALYHFRHPDGTLALDLHLVQDATGAWVLDTYWTEAAPRTSGWDMGTQFGYDAHGRVAAVTAPKVQVTEEGVGAGVQVRPVVRTRSLEMAVLAPAGTGGVSNPAPRVRPEAVRVEATDARGDTTKMALDPLGQPVRIEEPLGRLTVLTRDRFGRVVRTRAPSGHVARAEYRGMDLRLTQDLTTEATVEMEYEPTFHQLTRAWGTGTTEVRNTYDTNDPQRKLLRTCTGPTCTDTSGPATLFTYHSDGRVASVTDPEGHGTTYDYWSLAEGSGNRRTATTGARATLWIYDGAGRESMSISPAQDTTRTEYDLLNRVAKSIDPAGGATDYTYLGGHLYRIRDPKGQYYHFHHNALGWLESDVDPRNQYRYYGYDRAGNQTWAKNRRGQTVTSGYNALNQRIRRDAPDGEWATWDYDPAGRWATTSNAHSSERLNFDVAGRMVEEVTSRGYNIHSTYNARGQRTEVRMAQGPRVVRYGYNARGELETLTDLNGGVTTIGYNEDGQESSRTLPTQLTVGRNYTSVHEEAAIHYDLAGVHELLTRSNSHNENGLIGKERRRYHDLDRNGDLVREYFYDRLQRLTGHDDRLFADGVSACSGTTAIDPNGGACMPGGAGTFMGGDRYGYDAVGNPAGQGTGVDTGNRLTAHEGYTLEYDADGNVTRKYRADGTFDQRLVWNSLGQLVQVWTSGVGDVYFRYDGWGRRIQKLTPARAHHYVYDGEHVFLEASACCVEAELTYYPGTDQPHSIRRSGAMYYYQTDALGNVVGLTGGANEVVNRYAYTPWGELQERTSNTYDPLGFTARERDDETRLYYYRARYYDPQLGRFLSEDPIGLEGGINPYAYVGNSPTNFRDPSGLCVGEKHTSKTTCEHDRITVVAPPPAPAPDPCARGACWNRGVGGSAGDGGGGGGGGGGGRISGFIQGAGKLVFSRCGARVGLLALSVAGDLTFAGGGVLAAKGVGRMIGSRFIRAAPGARRGLTRRTALRASRHLREGKAMFGFGATTAGLGWAGDLESNAIASMTLDGVNDPFWAYLPLGGSIDAGLDAYADCAEVIKSL